MEHTKEQVQDRTEARKRPRAQSKIRTPRAAVQAKTGTQDNAKENARGAPCCSNPWWP
jgi:hypothetical protein